MLFHFRSNYVSKICFAEHSASYAGVCSMMRVDVCGKCLLLSLDF